MKVIYEFDPFDDREELAVFQNARKYYSAIYDVTLALRNYHKYKENPEAQLQDQINAMNEVFHRIEQATIGLGYWEDT